jgi:mono/diheme cytochrome c family protein
MLGIGIETGLAGDPEELFVKSCAPCHSKDGKAQTPAAKKLGVKDLSLSKLTDSQIVEQIREGKQPSQTQSKMPAFKEKLTPEEIQSLVEIVKQFRK